MKVRRLQIENLELARLSVQTQMARLSISAPIRRIKAVSHERPQMTVNREVPRLEVNMESLHNNIGLKSSMTLMRDSAAQAQSQSVQSVKDIENNGDAVAVLPRSNNPIAAAARARLIRVNHPVMGSGQAMDPTVSIKSHTGSLNIDWRIQDISISWDDYQAPVITIEPKPRVDVTLVQPGRVEFCVVEQMIPPEKGRTIDKEA